MAGGTQAPRNKGRFPRVVSYRPEIDIEEGPDPSAKTTYVLQFGSVFLELDKKFRKI